MLHEIIEVTQYPHPMARLIVAAGNGSRGKIDEVGLHESCFTLDIVGREAQIGKAVKLSGRNTAERLLGQGRFARKDVASPVEEKLGWVDESE